MLLKNRYQILELLSEAGGFGQTFLAEDMDTPSRRRCVIKKLRPVADAEAFKFVQERFKREAAILEILGDGCDRIPKLYAYFIEDQEFYLVQELIDGLTLKQKVQREGTLDEHAVGHLVGSLLNVLDYVHQQKIIHRDIKPDNIILRRRDNEPVLIDFGIVKEVLRVGVDGGPTSSIMAGTPGYTALEQAAGRPVYASDLYSLGATAIYLVTGKNPLQMADPATGDIAWRQFAPWVSSGFAAVLNKAAESHPRDRYQTAAEMREDLLRVLKGGQLVGAPLPSTSTGEETLIRPVAAPPSTKTLRKPTVALIFGIAALLGLFTILGGMALLPKSNNSGRETLQTAGAQNSVSGADPNYASRLSENSHDAQAETRQNSNLPNNSLAGTINALSTTNSNANSNSGAAPPSARTRVVVRFEPAWLNDLGLPLYDSEMTAIVNTSAGKFSGKVDGGGTISISNIPCGEQISIALPPTHGWGGDTIYYKRFVKCDKPVVNLGQLKINGHQ